MSWLGAREKERGTDKASRRRDLVCMVVMVGVEVGGLCCVKIAGREQYLIFVAFCFVPLDCGGDGGPSSGGDGGFYR